jgi:subtilisin family serine protease
MNDDTNNPEAPNDSDTPDVLDTSGAGGPYIPPSAIPGPGEPPQSSGGPSDPHPQPPPPEELIVEVELAPGVENIDELLSGINVSDPPVAGGGPPESDMTTVARTYSVIEAQPLFTREEVERQQSRIDAVRNTIDSPDDVSGPPADPSGQLGQLDEFPRLSNFVTLRFPPGTPADEILAALNALPQVKQAVVVPRAAPPAFPTDGMIGNSGSQIQIDPLTGIQKQWYLHRTHIAGAWELGRGAGVVIADVDFGCRISHREFIGAIKHTFNSFDGTNEVTCGPHTGHGTAVLGIAGGRSDGQGLAGYAPEATLWVIQGDTGCSPRITFTPWSAAINHILDTDAGGKRKVILIELQTYPRAGNIEQIPSINLLIREAIAENCVVVVTAGNGDRPVNLTDNNQPFQPTGSILVGATVFHETENQRAAFSNHGLEVVVSAPGDEIRDVTCGSTHDTAYRNEFGGTSGAGAKVAGTVALMLSVNRFLSHADVRDILRATGSPIVTTEPCGVFLNAEAAVREAKNRLNQ